MSFIDRLKARFSSPLQRIGGDEDAQFTLRLPVTPGDGQHWLEVACVLHNEARADGEHLHIRAHLRADFARLLRAGRDPLPQGRGQQQRVPRGGDSDRLLAAETAVPEAAAGASAASARALSQGKAGRALGRGVARAGGAVTRILQSRPLRRLLEPVAEQRVESWMDIRATNAPLDHSSRAMLPAGLARLGVAPDPNGPPIQSWSAPTPRGMAQVTTMHLDEEHIVQSARARRAGKKPMRVAAAFAQIVESSDDVL